MKRFQITQIFLLSVGMAICLSWSGRSVSAATLHAILAGNTLDEYIGPAVTLDLEQFRQELNTIAETTGMLVRRVELTGTQLRKSTLIDTVSGLQPAPDDAVVFYFSGHGFSLQGKDAWPYMSLLDDEGIDEKWVFDTLAAARPRLLLVISDSCNNVIPEAYAPDISIGRRQLKTAGAVRENYQALFLYARGAILASSSKHSEVSSTFKDGSAFTRQFFSALRDAVTWARQPTWKEVMEAAIRPIWVEGEYQHPQYLEMPSLPGPASSTPTPLPPAATPTPIRQRTPMRPTVTPTPVPPRPTARPTVTPTPAIRRIPDLRVPELPGQQPTSTPTPRPTPTPRVLPTPIPVLPPVAAPDAPRREQTDCEYAETVLTIELYGSGNRLRFVVAEDAGHQGTYKLRDRFQEYTVYLAPGNRAEVYLHGEENEMIIPHDLSLCVYYEDLGQGNAVYISD